jgi:chaperonin GroEL (HSP60 family)
VVEAGIYDAVSVQKAALFGAIGIASMALTVDVLVQHAEPEQAPLPEPAKRKWL